MNISRSILLSAFAATALCACSRTILTTPAPIVTRETATTVVPEVVYGVVESIQLVQVMPPPVVTADSAAPVSPAHSTYQIGVRLSQGGYQVFTQDFGADLHVGEQVRIDHGIVRHA